jgi:hypothetical protein
MILHPAPHLPGWRETTIGVFATASGGTLPYPPPALFIYFFFFLQRQK